MKTKQRRWQAGFKHSYFFKMHLHHWSMEGKNRIVSLFWGGGMCVFSLILSSLFLPLSPFWNWVQTSPYFQLELAPEPSSCSKCLQVDSKWKLMELTAVTHLGYSQQVSWNHPLLYREFLVPLGKSPRKWAELDNGIVSLRCHWLPLLFSVFTIYFFKMDFF